MIKSLRLLFTLALFLVLLPFDSSAAAAVVAAVDPNDVFNYLALAGIALEVVARIVPTSHDKSIVNRLVKMIDFILPNRTKTAKGEPGRFIATMFKKKR